MKPITVSLEVPQPPEVVYDFLDVMANHEPFTNHFLTDWRYSGPARGVGSQVTVTARLGGASTQTTIEVVEIDPPRRIVEQSSSANGKRLGQGTRVPQLVGMRMGVERP